MLVSAYAATAADMPLAAWTLERRELGPDDIWIDIAFCGVCHSDLHAARDDWARTTYPIVPGHEIVGIVGRIGGAVTAFQVGDRVAVGCMVDSCRACSACTEGEEQYCEVGFVSTFGGLEKQTGRRTYGGYAKAVVVDQNFVLKVPDGLDLARAAPLLCAGITAYSPLRHWHVGPGQTVGVVGLGGLGHMAVKFARAMGAHVVVFTTSPQKAKDAADLGAHETIVSTDSNQMASQRSRFDFIIDTVSVAHQLDTYINLLRRDGVLCLVGAPPTPHRGPSAMALLAARRSLAGSLIGGIAETQEMLNFCGEHKIMADIELIAMDEINEAFDRMQRNDVRYRFVIDLATLD